LTKQKVKEREREVGFQKFSSKEQNTGSSSKGKIQGVPGIK